MNCQDFSEVVVDLARDQMLEANVRAGALDHASNCDACQLTLEDERALSNRLSTLVEAMKSFAAGPRIEAQLLASFRSQSSTRRLPIRPAHRRYWVAAAAVAALLVVGLVTMQRRRAVLPPENLAGSANPRTEIPLPTPESRQKMPSGSLARDRTPKNSGANQRRMDSSQAKASAYLNLSRGASPPSNTVSVNNEIATEFFPVGDTSKLSLEDGGQLVRLELPGSTLMRFGLPVNSDRANERVKADVLFGADGVARAIRFVR